MDAVVRKVFFIVSFFIAASVLFSDSAMALGYVEEAEKTAGPGCKAEEHPQGSEAKFGPVKYIYPRTALYMNCNAGATGDTEVSHQKCKIGNPVVTTTKGYLSGEVVTLTESYENECNIVEYTVYYWLVEPPSEVKVAPYINEVSILVGSEGLNIAIIVLAACTAFISVVILIPFMVNLLVRYLRGGK